MRHTRSFLILAVASVLVVAACGSKSTSSPPASGSNSTTPVTGHVAIPVKATPSISAKMICETEVQGEIASLLGVRPDQPLAPTWHNHIYSCTYHYKGGSLTLSVKELSDKAQTDAYFAELGQKLGDTEKINGLGQGAFTTSNKSAVVRKDYKVMLVDISKLPQKFGAYGDTRDAIALNVAATILSCWTGA